MAQRRKILILGSRGSLGSEFMRLYRDADLTGWDKAELDITDEPAVKTKIGELKPELVINCTGFTAVDKAETERALADDVNGYGPGYIAKACEQIDATMIHMSTGMVFMGDKDIGYNEDDVAKPVNEYGKSKLLGEMEIRKNTEKYYIVRTCWLYGQPGVGDTTKKSFVDLMIDLAKQGKPLEVIDDEFGEPTYVKDLAQATRALVEQKNPYGIYHLSNEGQCSRYEWAQEIFLLKGLTPELTAVSGDKFERAAKRPKYEILNNTKFVELRPWTEALREYLR
jgi:dTDP-4-dehydrorhamnose reductase